MDHLAPYVDSHHEHESAQLWWTKKAKPKGFDSCGKPGLSFSEIFWRFLLDVIIIIFSNSERVPKLSKQREKIAVVSPAFAVSVAWDSNVDNTGYKLSQVRHRSEITLTIRKKLFVKLRWTDHQIVIFLVVQLMRCVLWILISTLCARVFWSPEMLAVMKMMVMMMVVVVTAEQ